MLSGIAFMKRTQTYLDFVQLVAANDDLHAGIALTKDRHPFGDLWVFPVAD